MGVPGDLPRKLTYDDYAALPEDGRRYELFDGELVVSPAPFPLHQRVVLNLVMLVASHVRTQRLGIVHVAPIDLILTDSTVLQPDVVFVSNARREFITWRAIEGPPELAVEVISTWSARRDRGTKAALYARFGVPHYWVVDPEQRTFEQYALVDGGYRLVDRAEGAAAVRADAVPGLAFALDALWLE